MPFNAASSDTALRSLTPLRSLLGIVLLAALGACNGSDPLDPEALDGGVLATFEVSGEEFRVWTDAPGTVAQLVALEGGESQATIPNGRLRPGPGRGDHNQPWSWHLDPDEVEMAEITVEVCDGRPSMVEEDRTYWLEQVGRFCPWGAELVELRDFR